MLFRSLPSSNATTNADLNIEPPVQIQTHSKQHERARSGSPPTQARGQDARPACPASPRFVASSAVPPADGDTAASAISVDPLTPPHGSDWAVPVPTLGAKRTANGMLKKDAVVGGGVGAPAAGRHVHAHKRSKSNVEAFFTASDKASAGANSSTNVGAKLSPDANSDANVLPNPWISQVRLFALQGRAGPD